MVQRHENWTLTQAARVVDQPQHKLIYLCQQGVVRPDLEDAKGRGSSRQFSATNLLEFAVAFELRRLRLPVPTLTALLRLLRRVEQFLRERDPHFFVDLLQLLQSDDAPAVRLVISDGRLAHVLYGLGRDLEPDVLDEVGGIDLRPFSDRHALDDDPITSRRRADRDDFGGPERSRYSRVEISVTRIARDLWLRA